MGGLGIFLLGTLLLLTQAQVGDSACPSPWKSTKHGCYLVVTEKLNWRNAQLTCEALDSGLAIITTNEENEAIWSMLKAVVGKGEQEPAVWIGLHDLLEDRHFQWVNYHPPIEYHNWAPGEPDAPGNRIEEDCVEMYADTGLWNDRQCHAELYFLCEKKDPSQTPERITVLEDKCHKVV